MITTRKRARLSSNWSDGRRVRSFALAAVLTTATVVGIGATSASANTVCDPGGDVCTVYPDTVQTPLGPVDVTVSSTDVVTVHLDPTFPDTLVVGVAISVPSGALALGCPTRCSRTTIATAGGLVVIDTVRVPPGSAWPAGHAQPGHHLHPSPRSLPGEHNRQHRDVHSNPDPAGSARVARNGQTSVVSARQRQLCIGRS